MNSIDDTAGLTELERWRAQLAAALGIDDADLPEVALVLDLARDAAHGVARPAAPLTTFMVGFALAKHGGSVRELSATASELAAAWSSD